jgi:hypothetical protein
MEKKMGVSSRPEKRVPEEVQIGAQAADGRSSSISSTSTASSHPSVETQSIHQTLSRNAGLEEPGEKALTTVSTNMTTDPRFEVDFDENGENPQDWSTAKKALVIAFMSFSTLVVVMYSTSYTSGLPGMMRDFGIKSKTLLVLGITTYLAGLALGSIVLAPLSEMYGRRPVYLIATTAFTILVIPCALANNLAQILVLRFFGAICGSAMISNAPGTGLLPSLYHSYSTNCIQSPIL